jgi:hypothetical protein
MLILPQAYINRTISVKSKIYPDVCDLERERGEKKKSPLVISQVLYPSISLKLILRYCFQKYPIIMLDRYYMLI